MSADPAPATSIKPVRSPTRSRCRSSSIPPSPWPTSSSVTRCSAPIRSGSCVPARFPGSASNRVARSGSRSTCPTATADLGPVQLINTHFSLHPRERVMAAGGVARTGLARPPGGAATTSSCAATSTRWRGSRPPPVDPATRRRPDRPGRSPAAAHLVRPVSRSVASIMCSSIRRWTVLARGGSGRHAGAGRVRSPPAGRRSCSACGRGPSDG